MPRFFTLQTATALLPQLERTVRTAVQAKSNQDHAEQALHGLIQRIMMMGGITVDQAGVAGLKNLRQSSMERLQPALDEIGEHGCLMQDLANGRVDFPTLLQGEEVYLCWCLDEPEITHWHNVHEGAEARKPIDRFFLDHHRD